MTNAESMQLALTVELWAHPLFTSIYEYSTFGWETDAAGHYIHRLDDLRVMKAEGWVKVGEL